MSKNYYIIRCWQFGMQPLNEGSVKEQTKSLATELGHLVIVRKGKVDIISDGKYSKCTELLYP